MKQGSSICSSMNDTEFANLVGFTTYDAPRDEYSTLVNMYKGDTMRATLLLRTTSDDVRPLEYFQFMQELWNSCHEVIQSVNEKFDNWLKLQPPTSDNLTLPQASRSNSVIRQSRDMAVADEVMSDAGWDRTNQGAFEDVTTSQSSVSLAPIPIPSSVVNTSTSVITQTTSAITGSIPSNRNPNLFDNEDYGDNDSIIDELEREDANDLPGGRMGAGGGPDGEPHDSDSDDSWVNN